MLSGLRALDTSRPPEQLNLVEWAKPFLMDQRKLAQLMDPRLEGQYPSKGAIQAAKLTLRCLAVDPKSRPSMKEVVAVLESIGSMKSRSIRSKGTSPRPVAHIHGGSGRRDQGLGSGRQANYQSPRLRWKWKIWSDSFFALFILRSCSFFLKDLRRELMYILLYQFWGCGVSLYKYLLIFKVLFNYMKPTKTLFAVAGRLCCCFRT